MVVQLCITMERVQKSRRVMQAIARGSLGKGLVRMSVTDPKRHEPFIIWGHRWHALRICPPAMKLNTPWWLVDNGYYKPADQEGRGYYSVTYRGWTPTYIPGADESRLPVPSPRRADPSGGHILVTLPGVHFGKALGFDRQLWKSTIIRKIREHTDRRIVIRAKATDRPLSGDLEGAHCLVTHSSKTAIDALFAGVPAIVDKSSCAAPIFTTKLSRIENPTYPNSEQFKKWWASLMAQQFTLAEMRQGLPWKDVLYDSDHNRSQNGRRLRPSPRSTTPG